MTIRNVAAWNSSGNWGLADFAKSWKFTCWMKRSGNPVDELAVDAIVVERRDHQYEAERGTGPAQLAAPAESARGRAVGAENQIGAGPLERGILTVGEGLDGRDVGQALTFHDEVVLEFVREQ